MNIKVIFFLIIFSPLIIFAQIGKDKKVKLLVGIVVDQMRYDYLEKFRNDFSSTGFNKLISEGTSFTNCKINYIPTVTGAGHASIYTGTLPYFHGIIANDWKDRITYEEINCCSSIEHENTMPVAGISKTSSPQQLLCTTIGDELKLNSNGKSKVFGVSLKDRGAILPAGRSADGAFWFDDKKGIFISSHHYYDELPSWVKEFNGSGKIESYLDKDWNLFKPIEHYSELPKDDSEFEADIFNEGKTSFPHTFKNISKESQYDKLAHTPFGNQILLDFVKEMVVHENLGMDEITDHMAISFSSTDKIGHEYGPHSYEVKDTYLRLDSQLGDLLNFLDTHIGNGNYLLFLTSDHGVMENIGYLEEMNFDAGTLENTNYFQDLQNFLLKKFNSENLIKTGFKRNIYLDNEEIMKLDLEKTAVENSIKEFLILQIPEIEEVYTRTELESMSASRNSSNYLLNGFNKKRSGDILYSLRTHYLVSEREYGSSHGSGHSYDNHIPLVFYGYGISAENRNEEVFIIDIAPTISDILGINYPSSSIGIPLLDN